MSGCASVKEQPEQVVESTRLETSAEETVSEMIRPLADTTMEALKDSVVHISFEQDGFYRDASGTVFLRMRVYSYEKFDMVDISCLKAGDSILLSGEEILVTSVKRNDYGTVLINGGLEEGGFDLATDNSGVYFVHGYDDMKSWNLVGEAECPVAECFVFTDSADLEHDPILYSAADVLDGIPAAEFGFWPQNTLVRIEEGQVVTLERIYTP